ncbi:ATP-binding protein [Mycolicibacterium sp. XJ2]
MVVMGVLHMISLRDYAYDLTDDRLTNSLGALRHSFTKLSYTEAHPQPFGMKGPDALITFTGQPVGSLIAVVRDGTVTGSAVFTDNEARHAPPGAVSALEAIEWNDNGSPFNAVLGELGRYRLKSMSIDDGDWLVAAASLRPTDQAVARGFVATVLLVIAALLVIAIGTLLIVRYALGPLRRVAATAATVAKLPLAAPENRIDIRIPDAYTDPDSEVGIVGQALNRLLVNVDSALAERAESDRRMRRFLADVSHELRTPLTAIQGYAELTRQDSAELPETTEYALARIEAESSRMSSLVADLLLLSRLDERQDLLTEDVDLNDLVTNAVSDIAVSATDRDWRTVLTEDPIWVSADRARLHQLITNLLMNAVDHTPPGTTVTTTVSRDLNAPGPARAKLTVHDDGPGIPAELLPHLFDRFVRADKSRSRKLGNLGLGLAIVQSVAQAHNGAVSVKSRPGATAFTVVLPEVVSRPGSQDRAVP